MSKVTEVPQQVEIAKVDLREGEELQSFIGGVLRALGQHKAKTKKSLILSGIFKGYVVTRDIENGRFFKLAASRDDKGNFTLGDPEEVRQAFVPVGKKEKAESEKTTSTLVAIEGDVHELPLEADIAGQLIIDIAKTAAADDPSYFTVQEPSLWSGLALTD